MFFIKRYNHYILEDYVMKENKYDDNLFFEKYGKMARSIGGLEAASEWSTFRRILPNFNDKRVLDLGCGYGWHCRYAIENKSKMVTGVDISEKMLQTAISKTKDKKVHYIHKSIEEVDFKEKSFDIIISSLALHYVESYDEIIKKIYKWLNKSGHFVFSIEHPIFTAYGNQDLIYSEENKILHLPVDNYFYEGRRDTIFLDEKVSILARFGHLFL